MHPAAGPRGRGLGWGASPSDTPTRVNKSPLPRELRARGAGNGARGAHAERAAARGPHGPGSPGASRRARGRRAHSPSWRNCSSSSFRGAGPGLGPGASSRGGWRRCPRRRRRSALPPPGGLASFVAPVTLGAGLPARLHTRARLLPAPRRPPSRRPRGPGPRAPTRPRRSPGPARGGRPGPRPAVPSSGR